ncbi:hypothetical protein [Bartonella tamiae]|nr:hypothetical protein [Bartonella tamiae]
MFIKNGTVILNIMDKEPYQKPYGHRVQLENPMFQHWLELQ